MSVEVCKATVYLFKDQKPETPEVLILKPVYEYETVLA